MANKNRNIGIISTTIFHIGLLLFVVFFGFATPFPLPEEEGILINFGVDETGSGEIETQMAIAQSVPQPQEQIQPQPTESSEATNDVKEEILTQDYEETARIEEQKKKDKEKKKEDERLEKIRKEQEAEKQRLEEIEKVKREEQERIDAQQRKIAESAKQAFGQAPTNSSGDGTGTKPGNMGDPDGSITSKSYIGGKGGGKDGIGFSLKGRTPQGGSLPLPSYPTKEEGTIVIKVKVDQNGNVKETEWEPKGSTTTDEKLIEAAKKAAMKAKFNQDRNADLIQLGTITYRFNIK
ncbi:MAG: TonB family protein [Salinivirgaceae bacterium]|nr:TonB family protein [Salinivirgaceae bacterium]MDY0282779.1 TonB family protein [Salinivirgaceae bacterium]